ncbi:MAG TPA: CoA-acylating methylmalonate-semialdehyde dehydrogenase [Kiritimatiellia bacterium]|nr:CoA-acylating methylmalonate-semialdehyde dehydrogenase [Kiritimatiellia bacterium]HMP33659.1 CoA-acylating methylmalonate-semialdehyde dehydrogenase [Kiritimatiellia bacterium]
MTTSTLYPVPVFIGGAWHVPPTATTTPVYNPSIGEVIAHTPMCGGDVVDQAVQAAQKAFPDWAETPPVERARILFRYKMLLEDHFEELARSVSREHGKNIIEARGDVRRGVEVVEYACAAPELLKGEILPNIARGIDGEVVRHPHGVVAGICPYNFPALVPMWMFPLALACGNTFILKPSEKVPLTGIRLIELLQQAGLPAGVLNIVHGGKECVDALLKHPLIKAISFVGSSPVAKYIYETGIMHGKKVQAAGGAKNYVFVLPDADFGNSVTGLVDSAFGCAGQRCMAGSTAVTIGKAHDQLVKPLSEAVRKIKVGRTDGEVPNHLGAVISPQHLEKVSGLIASGEKDGAQVVVDGRGVKVPDAPKGFYLGPTILDGVRQGMHIAREEVFGPVLNVMSFDDLDSAIEMANQTPFGNGACIYTQSGKAAREFKHRIKAGMVGINVGVPAPMAPFPFAGWDYSFFGELHMQGREGVMFYTRAKVTTTRWFRHGEGDIWHKEEKK